MIETYHVPLNPCKEFRLPLPTRFLPDESHRDRVVEVWNQDVIPKINHLCRARKSGFINRSLKRSVFQSAMDNVCKDFSRRTDNINVEFRQETERDQYHPNRKSIKYSLVFTKLSAVTNNLRSARYCVAEIPQNPNTMPAVEAEFVTTTEEDGGGGDRAAQGDTSGPSAIPSERQAIPFAHSEIVATTVPIQYQVETTYVNPPVASEVTATVEEEDELLEDLRSIRNLTNSDRDSQRSAFDRMQELESIKAFLTEEEYSTKRQAILDSI